MIPLKLIPWQSDAWTRALADAITDPRTLLERLGLDANDVDFAPDFPLRVPHSFVDRMRLRDPRDPLLRQVLPLLTDAVKSRRQWVGDFYDDDITISSDLYEVLLAYQHFRRPSA